LSIHSLVNSTGNQWSLILIIVVYFISIKLVNCFLSFIFVTHFLKSNRKCTSIIGTWKNNHFFSLPNIFPSMCQFLLPVCSVHTVVKFVAHMWSPYFKVGKYCCAFIRLTYLDNLQVISSISLDWKLHMIFENLTILSWGELSRIHFA
jgi:hypothetical protein